MAYHDEISPPARAFKPRPRRVLENYCKHMPTMNQPQVREKDIILKGEQLHLTIHGWMVPAYSLLEQRLTGDIQRFIEVSLQTPE
jgi:hypothetical protein